MASVLESPNARENQYQGECFNTAHAIYIVCACDGTAASTGQKLLTISHIWQLLGLRLIVFALLYQRD